MQKLMKHLHKSEKGFTLVELMVVVVIIGILVAIAIPIYGTVQDNARNKASLADNRIVAGAVQMYYMASNATGALPTKNEDILPFISGGALPVGTTVSYGPPVVVTSVSTASAPVTTTTTVTK